MQRLVSALSRCIQGRAVTTLVPTATEGVDTLEASLRSLSKSSGLIDIKQLGKLMRKLIQCSDSRKARLCKEACRMAHAAGLHAECAEMFFSCRKMGPVTLNDLVINAAACTLDPEYLQKCLSNSDGTSLTRGLASHEAVIVLRIFWQSTRCFVCIERSRKEWSEDRGERGAAKQRETVLGRYRAVSEEAFRLLKLPDDVLFSDWWARVKRLVLYHQKDKGEAAVYEQFFSCWENYHGEEFLKWVEPPCLVAMLRSCVKGERWDLAGRYVNVSRDCLLSRANHPDDTLLQHCLTYFSSSSFSKAGVVWFGRIREALVGYIPSAMVIHSAARLAGDAGDGELAVWCLQALLSERQPSSPSPHSIFPCLVALAKCRVKDFKKVLRTLEESGHVKQTGEEYLYLDLLYSRHNLFLGEELVQRVEKHLTHVDGCLSRAGFSVRNATLFLRIVQEMEHVSFFKYYMVLKRELQADASDYARAQWLSIALKWVLTQPTLKNSDYETLMMEARALLNDGKTTGAGPPLVGYSLNSKITSRLAAIHQLQGKEAPRGLVDEATVVAPIMRFTRQRHRLPRSQPPWIEAVKPPRQRELWQVRRTLEALAQREWRERVQR
ncbi:uncharacterized protein TEOVI_000868300 [Trypanosoma equiperdum]|uniref:Uncharacterized protein n=2 Tax=Trypanozoon TaxID=39700 RepID=Q580J9_TRYB2|nr:hypothetical protein, conserved [Trypanosoma brucei brucei TREU927]AAX79297.1 hypothetical protein, conserved [Trypanosoma brucei]AAZ10476.1 hypothetical protein, conserved [Trypanosoma brucei brucei TREU927]SCU67247.1 hypothetical protein, conserved [Trypanosoma equiperdum]